MPPDPRFPIGPIQDIAEHQHAGLEAAAARMEQATRDWRALLTGLSQADLGRTYRPASWTVLQLAHHTADAHLHGLNRLRYALTTPAYVIQPFDQDAWIGLPDAALPVSDALNLLEAANARWVALLGGVDAAQFDRRITHPDDGEQDLWGLIAKHDWHIRHHLAHVRLALGVPQPTA